MPCEETGQHQVLSFAMFFKSKYAFTQEGMCGRIKMHVTVGESNTHYLGCLERHISVLLHAIQGTSEAIRLSMRSIPCCLQYFITLCQIAYYILVALFLTFSCPSLVQSVKITKEGRAFHKMIESFMKLVKIQYVVARDILSVTEVLRASHGPIRKQLSNVKVLRCMEKKETTKSREPLMNLSHSQTKKGR